VRFLLDANLSPRLIEPLTTAGCDVTHVGGFGLLHATDPDIFDFAVREGYVIVTADSDFPMLVALRRATSPSVIHLRHVAELAPERHIGLLIANLPAIGEDLDRGVIVSLSPSRLAIRELPVR
jgi:predicted nuclease of predicted toxin-antitoxin system